VPTLTARPVQPTAELARIRSLPRREITLALRERAARDWTKRLALRAGVAIRGWQGACLAEATRPGNTTGGVNFLPVGQGKTLLVETIGLAVGATRSVLIAPAALRNKTFADRASYRGVWRTAQPPPRFISKEELAREENAMLLEQIDPTDVFIDESDDLANLSVGGPKRIDRFVRNKRKRGGVVRVWTFTGTPTRRSIMGYWHHLVWCLGEDGAPVPRTRAEAETWAKALDDAAPRQGYRPRPGALGHDLESARAWYLDRLRSTPGVVICDEDSAADVPLSVGIELAPECPTLDEAFHRLRTKWESPSGEPVSDPLSLFRIEGQLGCGLYTYFDPPPPQAWSDARKADAAFIRARIQATAHAMRPLDTDAQVRRAHPDAPAVREWLAIRDTFDMARASRTRWISTATLDAVVAWLDEGEEPSVVWCGSVPFAERLAKTAKVAHYGSQGCDKSTGRELHTADVRASMVCSWHANRRGFNLQAWRRHLIVLPPQSAKALEQIIGRSHRAGQTHPVRFTILATSGGTLDSFAAAFSEAEFARDTAGSTQKILRATIEPLPEPPTTLRWATK
jgi:hypothetical protein